MKNNFPDKNTTRKWAKEERLRLGSEKIKLISSEIVKKIKSLNEYKNAKNIMSYFPKDLEIDLTELFEDDSKEWYLPTIRPLSSIIAVPYEHKKTKLIQGLHGIMEPEIINENFYDQKINKIKLDLIFVPGLCFDKEKNRLGYGKGFYDNFLKLNLNSFKIGTCPKELLVEKIPADSWDEKVDMVIMYS